MSFFNMGQKKPTMYILETKLRVLEWFLHSPACRPFSRNWHLPCSRHLRYGPSMDFRYNVLSRMAKKAALCFIWMALRWSSGSFMCYIYSLRGVIHDSSSYEMGQASIPPELLITDHFVSSRGITQGIFLGMDAARFSNVSAWELSSGRIWHTSSELNFVAKSFTRSMYGWILGSLT